MTVARFRLVTARLLLDDHVAADAERMNAWENDPELLRFNDGEPPGRPPVALAETRAWLAGVIAAPDEAFLRYAIRPRGGGAPLGYGIVAFIDRWNRSCRLSVTIGERGAWRRGYAREALVAVIGHCFDELRMNRIGAEIHRFNERSIRLFRSLGFTEEGAAREAVRTGDGFADELLFGLLEREWREAEPRPGGAEV